MGKQSKNVAKEKEKTVKKDGKHKKTKNTVYDDVPSIPLELLVENGDDMNNLIERHKEACNVIDQKKIALASNQLPYLEYIEIHEEILRLNDFRDNIQVKIRMLRRLKKK